MPSKHHFVERRFLVRATVKISSHLAPSRHTYSTQVNTSNCTSRCTVRSVELIVRSSRRPSNV
uniref:Uncharacterized protein n=1 Tax=Ornithodoros brasiliensis TaxID=888526 RepID=A0A1D2AHK7_ORNBR